MFRHALTALAAVLTLSLSLLAQDYTAVTAQDPGVELAVLELQLKPLQLAEVEAEAQAWIALLAAKTAEISRDRIAARTATGEALADLNRRLSNGVDQQKAIAVRIETVLDALSARGGEVDKYEKYVDASTGVEIDATDASATYEMAKNWLISPDGGIRLGINLVLFALTLIAFTILAKILAGVVRRAVSRLRGTSELLRDFFVNTVRKVTFLIGLVVALGVLGVEVGPFVAAIGAAGFVIAFALQGTLSNFAAGIMILVYRPYDLGQVVTVAGTTGKVDEMSLVSTTLRLPDNQTVIVPNNSIWGGVITNISGQKTRRVDMVFGCSYGDDLKKAQRVLEEIVTSHEKVLAEPAPNVRVHALADSSVNFIVRPWVNTADYWDVFWDVTRQVKDRFDAEGISIPFPQRDVHLHQVKD